MAESNFRGIKFSDADVVEADSWVAAGECNPHNVRPWLLHDHGFVLAVVFADCLQDALDAAVDAGKLDGLMLSAEDHAQYESDGWDVAYLGNASEPFDIESLGVEELPNPPRSFCAQFNAMDSNPAPR
jgi:hypothetical protein